VSDRGKIEKCTLSELCLLVTDGTHDSPKLLSEGVPFIKGKHISDGFIDFEHCDFISYEDHLKVVSRSKPEKHDILFSNIGSVGDAAYVDRDVEFSIKNVALFKPDPSKVDSRYLFYQVIGPQFQAELLLKKSGSAQPFIGLDTLRNHELLCHIDLREQQRIASILSAYDDLIENNNRRIKILEQMAQMLYREWFVIFRFPGHEKVKMVESEMGLIPEGWNPCPVTQAVDVDPTTKVPRDGVKPFVPMGSLSPNSMLINDVEKREGNSGSKFRNEDTLFARITPCLENGKTGFVQFLPTDDAVAFGSTEFIVLRSRTVCPEYVYLMARSDEFRDNAIKSMSGATGRQRVQQQCFGRFFMAQPPFDVLEHFQSAVAQMFRLIQTLSLKNTNLRKTRDLLLPKLVSGEVSVENLDTEALVETV
jgi:type I restriction enzyme S subunit